MVDATLDSILTFPCGCDVLEYFWVKATMISVRLCILFVTLRNINKLSDAVVGERQLYYLRTTDADFSQVPVAAGTIATVGTLCCVEIGETVGNL